MSAKAAEGAIAVADKTPSAGQPVRGSRMCPYRFPRWRNDWNCTPTCPTPYPSTAIRGAFVAGGAGRVGRRSIRWAAEEARARRRRAAGQDAAVSAVDKEVLDSMPQERLAAAIDGETLADAAEIQPHAWLAKADRPGDGVEFDQIAADERTGLFEAVCFGDGAARRAKPQASHNGPAVMS